MKRWLWWLLGIGVVAGVGAFAWSRRASAQLPASAPNPLTQKFCVRWGNFYARLQNQGVEDYFAVNAGSNDLINIEFVGDTANYMLAHPGGAVFSSGSTRPSGSDAATVLSKIRAAYQDAGQREWIQCVPGGL